MVQRVFALVAIASLTATMVAPVQGRRLLSGANGLTPEDAAWSVNALASKYPLMIKWYKQGIVDDLASVAKLCHPRLEQYMGLLYATNLGYLGDYFCAISTPQEQLARLATMIQQSFSKDRNTVLWGLPESEKPAWVNSGEVWPSACNIDFNAKVVETLNKPEHLGGQGLLCIPSTGN